MRESETHTHTQRQTDSMRERKKHREQERDTERDRDSITKGNIMVILFPLLLLPMQPLASQGLNYMAS